MNVERGCRRLVLVLSAAVVLLGIGLDILFLPPRPTTAVLQITLADRRQVTLRGVPHELIPPAEEQELIDRHASQAFDYAKAKQDIRQAVDRYGQLASKITDLPGFGWLPVPGYPRIKMASVSWVDIRQVELLREEGPPRLSWLVQHSTLSRLAFGLGIALWVIFFAGRFVARGFGS
jgi:hypothetical protein